MVVPRNRVLVEVIGKEPTVRVCVWQQRTIPELELQRGCPSVPQQIQPADVAVACHLRVALPRKSEVHGQIDFAHTRMRHGGAPLCNASRVPIEPANGYGILHQPQDSCNVMPLRRRKYRNKVTYITIHLTKYSWWWTETCGTPTHSSRGKMFAD